MNHQDEYTPTPENGDKLEAEFHYEQNKFLKWLDNYWYHYKWVTIIVAFFVTIAIVLIVQFVSKPKYDLTVVCGSPYRMNSEEHLAYEKLLEKFLPEDYDGDGEKSVNIIVYEIFSDAEYVEAKSEAEKNSAEFAINAKYNADELQNFSQQSMLGESYLFLVSEYLYNQLRSGDRVLPLSALYPDGNVPAAATEDGYGIRLAETDYYRFHPQSQCLPDDLVLCVLRKAEFNNSDKDMAKYDRAKALFHAIADYEVKE